LTEINKIYPFQPLFRDSQIKQQVKPSSFTEEPQPSSDKVWEFPLEGGKIKFETGPCVNNSPSGREQSADSQDNQVKLGSTKKNPSTIDSIHTKNNVRSTGATSRYLRIDPI
jgi:hypothetical protein